ncbi:MAG: BCCT family transporter [Alteromonadaceae bacterium]|nr:BCCT family transporter [Alteromonadaceae bacterium]
MQQAILSVAIIVTLLSSLFIAIRWRNLECKGEMSTSLFAFIAILFTSGLDVGLIMFPLTEFPTYASEAPYDFANPLAIEFGFWGFLVWVFYFLTTFYFCKVEPKVKIFEIPLVKFFNNVVIIGTCAFTGFLFLSYLPSYIEGITESAKFGLVAIVVLFAVLSSTDVKYVKILSVASTWLFFVLIFVMWLDSDMGFIGLGLTMSDIGEYFTHIDRFISPLTDYHAFYLFWWFSWSIMIGQFVSRFVGGLKTWQLLLALTIIPSIPIAIWFSVLYYYHSNVIEVVGTLKIAMVVVGVIFVINSLDSLIRLYTDNLKLTVKTLGKGKYIIGNWVTIFGLVLLYQFTPLQIEWIGLIVIGIYIAVYALLIKKNLDKTLEPLE